MVELSVFTYAIVPTYNLDYSKEDISWMPTVYFSNATLLSIFTICSQLIDVIKKSETRRTASILKQDPMTHKKFKERQFDMTIRNKKPPFLSEKTTVKQHDISLPGSPSLASPPPPTPSHLSEIVGLITVRIRRGLAWINQLGRDQFFQEGRSLCYDCACMVQVRLTSLGLLSVPLYPSALLVFTPVNWLVFALFTPWQPLRSYQGQKYIHEIMLACFLVWWWPDQCVLSYLLSGLAEIRMTVNLHIQVVLFCLFLFCTHHWDSSSEHLLPLDSSSIHA